MDLEVVGRHALLFDDDANAAFVNSSDALVEWHSLLIDRYDVRHLLAAPPPSRRRNRNSETIQLDDPSLQSQLDYERYLDLILQPDEPGIEEDEKTSYTGGYRAVAFSYGNNDGTTDQNNVAAGLESSGFRPPFPIPGDFIHSLPPTEKVHQIISRTAIFVCKNGGQSEIILRVKQGDNPTFGFLMPDHHLHAYFRFLVEHPDLLNSEFDGRPQDEGQNDGGEHNSGKGIEGALSLLGSVYGSGEEEDDGNIAETEKGVSQDNVADVKITVAHDSKKNLESKVDSDKDELVSRSLILSNKEKVVAVKKNSMVTSSKTGSVKGAKKADKSGLFSAAEGIAKSSAMEMISKVEPLILEPPPELKRIIDKLVEFVVRNGKQFEATLIEKDSKDGRFPFLLPSNQYHSYYLKVLQTAQESKIYGRSSYSGKEKIFSSLPSTASDIPLEFDRKEKFKMVIGKSKKETDEAELKGTKHEPGISIDAATAAAILQAATRGIKNPNVQMISTTSASANGHVKSSTGDQAVPDKAVEKSNQSEAPLTEEQKLKAERLKRAKMFVSMLKSGAVPHKPGTSRSPSVETFKSGAEVNLNGQEREASLAPATGEKSDRNYFDEHSEPLSKRKYRSRSGKSEEDSEEDNEDQEEHDDRRSRRKYRSRSRREEEEEEHEDLLEMEQKHHKKRHRFRSSSEENKDEDKNHKRSRKKNRSHHSSHEHSKKRRSSKHHEEEEEEEDETDNKRREHTESSRRKHHSRRSSHRTKDKHRHSSRRQRKDHGSSDDEHIKSESISDTHKKQLNDGDELEEGEITSRVLRQSREIVSAHVSRETSVDVESSQQRASSQPAEVPNDLRAKVRAMLMATRLS